MSKSLYKDILSTLKFQSPTPITGKNLHRLVVLTSMICSCIWTKSSSLEGISAEGQGKEKQKESQIKQSKRWLSSKWTDCETFFSPFARQILSSLARKGELVLIVDGSQTGSICTTLMISVVFNKYAIPITWLTKKGQKGHFSEELHLELVAYVKQLIPNNCRVVLLADGEFDGLKLRQACKINSWEYVLRTSTDRKVDCGGEVAPLNSIYPNQGEEIAFLEDACDGDNAICWHNKDYEHPILLLTNMDVGAMACEYYRRRFKIETLFKYLKSGGFKLHKTKLGSPERIKNLIIVVAYAFIFTFSIGVTLKSQPPKLLAKFTRKDRIDHIHPITLAQKCLFSDFNLAKFIFAQVAKNWIAFFT